ncbi:MAG: aminotransferase class I/II-fold pyridoxal phosphate-dependent enzyme, partial [Acidobacteria bacterium]|nr:aminotransferase class I/II-fold pyridoxal phosphate-dependent enzyme [Acidobacteriota bacterium]NIM60195.1 aminotransferase class I/II-fold pyridoxal phosphate-dependent enzyme [Acidobacteriota bacterium]NIO57864.1 aminotransferase class I/II-fold pyridoxal phosphate-dependent enzyme [Acidobacteriota bacterium]NIQ28873.1 aminotransferase class I/II-fold pyridoxal phosphate-dependent enzyme [Acidobacteriota bacterium]NIQ83331.1 aminotransferase class I/II-fold pyridoxal phosphate-dependent e
MSDNVRGLVGSEILRMAAEINAMVAAGEQICNLTVGDFDSAQFPIPARFLEHIQQAYLDGETNYPPADGVAVLREAVCEYAAREWGARYPVESVLIASGARPILYGAYRSVVNPGDKVVYPVPSWNNNHYAWMTGAEGVVVPTRPEDGFMPTLEQLTPHLAEARLICLNSPLNPTGTVIRENELRAIAEAIVEENERRTRAGKRHLFLIHDQVYAALIFDSNRHHMPTELVPEAAPWVISLDGISKCFASTGLRVGWVFAAPALVRRMKGLIGHLGAWAPRPEQIALARFLNEPDAVREFQQDMNDRVQRRLHALFEGFEQLREQGYPVECVSPQGAIYLSLRLDLIGKTVAGARVESNEQIRRLLLERAGMAVVPFQAFGLDEESGW